VDISEYVLIPLHRLTETFSLDKVKEMLREIVVSCFERAREQEKIDVGHIKLERGFATIPLPGIDVPFHSRYLWAGVMPFHACKHYYSTCALPPLTYAIL
jgi:fatty acid synthase subunit alpha